MFALQEPVGRLVAERPERAQVFEEFDIDYCCGGKRTLGDACARRGIDPNVVVKKLETIDARLATADTDWEVEPLGALCDHIVAMHHTFLRRELPRVQRLLAKIAHVHAGNHPELNQLLAVYEPFARDMEVHMDKEEQVLFPLVKRLAAGEIPPNRSMIGPIRIMESDHDEAGFALAEMRQLTNDYRLPADACNTYRAAFAGLHDLEQDLHRHVHLENNVLFPRVEQIVYAN